MSFSIEHLFESPRRRQERLQNQNSRIHAFWILCLVFGLFGAYMGGEGVIVALLGRQTTAEVTGREPTVLGIQALAYQAILPDGTLVLGSTVFGASLAIGQKIDIRFLPFKTSWNIRSVGSRFMDVLLQLLICIGWLSTIGMLQFVFSFLPDQPPEEH